MRIDGHIQHVETVDSALGRMLDDKIRARASMDLSQRHAPIDGRMSLRYPEYVIDVRVSVLPSQEDKKSFVDYSTSRMPV